MKTPPVVLNMVLCISYISHNFYLNPWQYPANLCLIFHPVLIKSLSLALLGCPNCLCSLLAIYFFFFFDFSSILSIVNSTSTKFESSNYDAFRFKLVSFNGIAQCSLVVKCKWISLPNILILSFTKSIFDSATFILSLLSNRGISHFTTFVFSDTFQCRQYCMQITALFSEATTFPSPNLNSVSEVKSCIFFLSSSLRLSIYFSNSCPHTILVQPLPKTAKLSVSPRTFWT